MVDIQIQGPEARISKNWCSLKKKKSYDLVFHFFLPESRWSLKKMSSPRIDLAFPTFRPDFIMISKKHLQRNQTICAIFEEPPKIEEGPSKKRGPRQLPHSPHPISGTDCSEIFKFLPDFFPSDFSSLEILNSSLGSQVAHFEKQYWYRLYNYTTEYLKQEHSLMHRIVIHINHNSNLKRIIAVFRFLS